MADRRTMFYLEPGKPERRGSMLDNRSDTSDSREVWSDAYRQVSQMHDAVRVPYLSYVGATNKPVNGPERIRVRVRPLHTFYIWRMDGYGALHRVIDTVQAATSNTALCVAWSRHGESDIAITTARAPTYYTHVERAAASGWLGLLRGSGE